MISLVERPKHIEALLVHTMGEEEHQNRPHLRGRSIVEAAVRLSEILNIPRLVFSGHHYWLGENRPSIGLMTAQEALRQLEAKQISKSVTYLPTYPVHHGEEIIQRPVTETSAEVIAFLAYCDQLGIHRENLASISSKTHTRSIEDFYSTRHVPATVFSAEAVLRELPDPLVTQLYLYIIEDIRHSEDERNFKRREKIKILLYQWLPFDLGEKLLRAVSEKQRKISPYPLESIDFAR